jgi:hypothetical protein
VDAARFGGEDEAAGVLAIAEERIDIITQKLRKEQDHNELLVVK